MTENAFFFLGGVQLYFSAGYRIIEPKASWALNKCFTTELYHRSAEVIFTHTFAKAFEL